MRWRVFHRTVQDIKARNADTDPDELQGIIDDAVREVREQGAPKGRPAKPDARGARYQYPGFRPHGPNGTPGAVYRAWQEGYFTLLTCAEQLDELRATLRKPAIAERIKPYKAGRLVNEMKELAEDDRRAAARPALPRSHRRFSAGFVRSGQADYLVTGDKGGLLALVRHHGTRIVSAREFAALFA